MPRDIAIKLARDTMGNGRFQADLAHRAAIQAEAWTPPERASRGDSP
jgi:hypothetical protein